MGPPRLGVGRGMVFARPVAIAVDNYSHVHLCRVVGFSGGGGIPAVSISAAFGTVSLDVA